MARIAGIVAGWLRGISIEGLESRRLRRHKGVQHDRTLLFRSGRQKEGWEGYTFEIARSHDADRAPCDDIPGGR
jgi:hypothetical protein